MTDRDQLIFRLVDPQNVLMSDVHEAVVRHRTRLEWAARVADALLWPHAITLQTILMFDAKLGKAPDSLDAVREFLETSDDQWSTHNLASLREEIKDLNALKQEDPTIKDLDVLIDNVVRETRKDYHQNIAKRYFAICKGEAVGGKTGAADTGPDAATAWVRSRWAQDLNDSPPRMAGLLHENTEFLKQQLANYAVSGKEERILTGLPKVDQSFVIKKGKTMFILGTSGDGKSTLVNSLVYRWAKAGQNVLYVTLENTPQEVWESLAFVHTFHYRRQFYLPALGLWQAGEVTEENRKNMDMVIDDIKARSHVRGIIDVQQFWTLDEIMGYHSANKDKHHYSVVVVDYLGKLNVPPGKGPSDLFNARNAMISAAVRWVQKDQSFLLVSPSQVNREGHKGAKKNEGIYDLDAMYFGSAAQQDTDLAISVFSDDDMKSKNNMEIRCVKHRGTKPFPPHELHLDARSEFVFDIMGERFHDDGLELIPEDVEEPPPAPTVVDIQIADEEVL